MKLIVAIIKPFRLDVVRDALNTLGIEGMTIGEVTGFGRQRGHTEIYRGAEYQIDFQPKLKLEIAVPSEKAEAVADAVEQAARTGAIGDGKIFIYDLERVVRVRTGELDENAL
ncbi:P-II family nitrogen regulator [Zavarzinia sp. CC-PAN008]|uniref:P-II family nitrogen regulator n=1 Tax=Zavarzinia sp. CC-PAN008 TaxID=3243332 RepID=UPI003F749257